MKQFLLLLILGCLNLPLVQGQEAASVPAGINFQAVARSLDGQIKGDMPVFLRISLTSADEEAKVFYLEEHRAYTDEFGLFDIVIGQGNRQLGNSILEVPWAKEDVWLRIEMATSASSQYELVSNSQMLAVPIALYAERADRLVDEEALLRNQSIYWATSGNNESRPDQHFIGTRDNEDFVIRTNNEERARFTKEGQLQITAGPLNGLNDQENKDSYPVTIEGSNQGIHILINENRSTDNNFITFKDPEQIWGTVEGETYQELITSRNYIIEATLFAISIASYTAQTISDAVEGAGLFGSIFAAGAGAGAIAEGVSAGAAGISLGTQLAAWIAKNAVCVGVAYTSGSADYAEYLLRDPKVPDITPGRVVGVRGGMVSLDTENADHFMVVSSRPIVLGNKPTVELEPLYEKIAFMGQVPVWVAGPVAVGDYILPSGNNDGYGIAVCPEEMKLGDYARVVGVAWEAGLDELVNVVNVAVGINSEDMGQRADILNRQVDNIMAFLEGKANLITDPQLLKAESDFDQSFSSVQKILSDEEFMGIIKEHEGMMEDIFDQARHSLELQGFDISRYPALEGFFSDPISFIEQMRQDPSMTTQWSFADEKLKKILEKQN